MSDELILTPGVIKVAVKPALVTPVLVVSAHDRGTILPNVRSDSVLTTELIVEAY